MSSCPEAEEEREAMNLFDLIILGVVALFTFLGTRRGLSNAILSSNSMCSPKVAIPDWKKRGASLRYPM